VQGGYLLEWQVLSHMHHKRLAHEELVKSANQEHIDDRHNQCAHHLGVGSMPIVEQLCDVCNHQMHQRMNPIWGLLTIFHTL
jgi:hypothetical protein